MLSPTQCRWSYCVHGMIDELLASQTAVAVQFDRFVRFPRSPRRSPVNTQDNVAGLIVGTERLGIRSQTAYPNKAGTASRALEGLHMKAPNESCVATPAHVSAEPDEELFDILDGHGISTGRTEKRADAHSQGLWHRWVLSTVHRIGCHCVQMCITLILYAYAC